jgi:Ca2+-binding RTX toxin-like protein
MYTIGNSGADSLVGAAEDDILDGAAGNDTLQGGLGQDTLYGGNDRDFLLGGEGNDLLHGEAGDDTLDGGLGADTLEGGLGFDYASYANATAGVRVDLAAGGLGGDALNDRYIGIEAVFGSRHDDVVWGDAGGNAFIDNGGNDRFDGRDGDDRYGPGNRTGSDSQPVGVELAFGADASALLANLGLNAVSLGVQEDIATGSGVAVRVLGGGSFEVDVLTRVEAFDGSNGVDHLRGDAGENYFRPSGSGDTVNGGTGFDHISFTLYSGPVVADIASGSASIASQTVVFSGIEALRGTAADDQLSGDAARNWLNGATGRDVLNGRDGADHLLGEDGNDVLTGGNGNDLLDGGAGADVLDGGGGFDTVSYDAAGEFVKVDLLKAVGTAGIAASDRLLNVEAVSGSGHGDWLRGDNLDNVIDGRAGSDEIYGCAGDDLIRGDVGPLLATLSDGRFPAETDPEEACNCAVDEVHDTPTGNPTRNAVDNPIGNGPPVGNSDIIDGGDGHDTIFGDQGTDLLDGDCGNDVVVGGDAIDLMWGGEGDDTLEGGAGIDLMFGGTGFDVLRYGRSGEAVNVDLSNPQATGGGEASDDLIAALLDLLVSTQDPQTLVSNALFTQMLESLGEIGGDESILEVGDFFNVDIEGIEGSAYSDRLGGNAADNRLLGLGGNDTLVGAAGNDTLDGGGGADSMTGGAGNDAYTVDSSSDRVAEADGGGTDSVATTLPAYTLGSWIENGRILATGTASLSGNELANVLVSGRGNNLIEGKGGIDTVSYAGGIAGFVGVTVSLATASPQATGGSGTDTLISIENLVGSDESDRLTGNSGANVLVGGDGNDTLNGGAGNDTLEGGVWGDTYFVDAAGDVVRELSAADGFDDLVSASIDWTLGNHLEYLTLTGSARIGKGNSLDNRLTGNAQANTLEGDAGNDTLDGSTGADTLKGGSGNDVYVIDQAADGVVESANAGYDTVRSAITYTLKADLEALELTGSGAINGTGNALDNLIVAGNGNNVLDGSTGVDTLSYSRAASKVTVSLASTAAQATGGSGTDTLRNFENLVGSAHADRLTGNSGNNQLDGAAGADTLAGGAGNDVYRVDEAGDRIEEASGAGTDRVESLVSWTLGSTLENLRLLGSGAINGTGNASNNVIWAGDGDNRLDGAGGIDTLSYSFAARAVGVSLAISGAQATGGSGAETVTGFENLTGSTFADNLVGNAAANVMDGGAGVDTLAGGSGNDTYVVDQTGEVVREFANGGLDTVRASKNFTLPAEVENLVLTGTSALNGTGNSGWNVITANAGNNVVDGSSGYDTLSFAAATAAVTFSLAVTAAQATGGSGTDTARNIENLTGGSAADRLTGSSADNLLDGGAGNDTLTGGSGNDTFVVNSSGDVVSELSGGGTDTVLSSVSWTLAATLENLELQGSASLNGVGNTANNTLAGNAGANRLTGGAGKDTLYGNGGRDTLDGGTGNDIYSVDSSDDIVIESSTLAGEIDRVVSSVDYTLGANVEQLQLGPNADMGVGNAAANLIIGNTSRANTLQGGGGNDTLVGGSAAGDVLDGGTGNDYLQGNSGSTTFHVDSSGDVVTDVNQITSIDRVISTISFVLPDHIENLTLVGTSAINGTGNTLPNQIIGNSAANRLDGSTDSAVDDLRGGAGNDIYVVGVGDVVVEAASAGTDTVITEIDNYTLGTEVENLTLSGIAAIGLGNSKNNKLLGNASHNLLDGGSGNDTLTGGAGIDTLVGGTGNDRYVVDSPADLIDEDQGTSNAGEIDTVEASFSYALPNPLGGTWALENVVLAGSAAIDATGNTLPNVLTGNSAANRLDGGVGADTLVGGNGGDTYVVDGFGDLITETGSGGRDSVETALDFVLPAGIEDLRMLGSQTFGTGNLLDNVIYANPSNNVLDGLDGFDVLSLRYGVALSAGVTYDLSSNYQTNVLTGEDFFFNFEGLEGTLFNDSLYGNGLANSLSGLSGNDFLSGAGGNDTLKGGAGFDVLQGGSGVDTFAVDAAASGYSDRFEDFLIGEDRVSISPELLGLPAGPLPAQLFATDFISNPGARVVYAGQALYIDTVYYAEFANTFGTLSASDFVIG